METTRTDQNKLAFVDLLKESEPLSEQRRSADLRSFEFTYQAEITNIYPMTESEKLYQIQITDPGRKSLFHFKPGQFVMLEVPGVGEAPFSISSSPLRRGFIELCIRDVGDLTHFLSRMERGAQVGIRGPFGTHFPLDKMEGQDLILVAGGLGTVPLRSPILSVLENRSRYNRVDVIYGSRTPAELLFTYQYDTWRKFDISLQVTVDVPTNDWAGPVGMVTKILQERLDHADEDFASKTWAIACGPPVMFKSVCGMLSAAGVPMQRMFVSLERRMHCGKGKCCRCNIGSTYTCLKGPVFDYWTVINLKEAI